MKNTLFYILLLSSIAIITCKKEVVPVIPEAPPTIHLTELGKIKMVINGDSIYQKGEMSISDSIWNISLTRTTQPYLEEALILTIINPEVRKQPISGNPLWFQAVDSMTISYSYLADHDQFLGAAWSQANRPDDYFEIVYLDKERGILEAKFEFLLREISPGELTNRGFPAEYTVSGVCYLKKTN
jgi:hypothetical protein